MPKTPSVQAVDAHRRLPQFLSSDETMQSLKTEFLACKVACGEIQEDFDIIRWWRGQVHLSKWKIAARNILHITPPSAAVE